MNTVMMTKMRPTVLFNVDNSEHRRYAWEFLQTKSWKNCPVMFALPNSEPNVYTMITRELSAWYASREFRANTGPTRIRAVKP